MNTGFLLTLTFIIASLTAVLYTLYHPNESFSVLVKIDLFMQRVFEIE